MILDAILENLRFTPDTVTYDGARHQLKALLATTLKSKMGDAPVLVLLLDGLNEVQGDTGYLLEEIGALSRLAGVRILITSRAEEKRLPFREISVSPLKDEDIEKALSAKGLLIPENPEIRQLLNTPLMLSIFIEASGSENQLRVEKEEELLEAYVKALLKKEMDALSDDEAEKYRIEAAVTYVLPALSDAMKKAGALTDAEMYAVCEKCRKTLQSGILVRAFPGFLGHRKEIALESADEFFGKMVHGILWHRMGLILRAENLSRISHARIGEYLSEIHSANVKRIKRRMLIKNALICAAGAAVLGALAAAYFTWGRYLTLDTTPPRPTYDDEQMELYLDYAIAGYSNYGKAYEHMIELLDYCDKGDKVNFDYWYPKRRDIIERYTDDIRSRNTMIDRVQKLLNSEGEVCSWSGQEVEDEYALALINLQKTCSIEYLREMDILAFWMKNEKVQKDYPNYPGLLRELVEADAWMSAQMYQLVYVPHQEGCNEAAHDRRLENIKEMGEIDQRRIMVSGEEARTKLKTAESERDDALNEVKTISNQIALDMNKD